MHTWFPAVFPLMCIVMLTKLKYPPSQVFLQLPLTIPQKLITREAAIKNI